MGGDDNDTDTDGGGVVTPEGSNTSTPSTTTTMTTSNSTESSPDEIERKAEAVIRNATKIAANTGRLPQPQPPSESQTQTGSIFSGATTITADGHEKTNHPPSTSADSEETRSTPRSNSSTATEHNATPKIPPPKLRPCHIKFIPTAEAMSNAVINILSICSSLLIFLTFLIGSYDYFKNVESNKCAMTWMYHYPYYVPLRIGSGVDEKFPNYHLHFYVEGDQAFESASKDTYRFTGIPVLFIPGNAGSYQQVRSLASIALWKHLESGTPFHFDFFTVDLNEEFSATYGYALKTQMEYTRMALEKIVNLYEEYHRVILVGHSMGGIIAKAVALQEDGESSLSNLIFTLATPHKNPVLTFDPEQDIFYYTVKKNWTKLKGEDSESKVTLVSLAGGERDYLVQPRWTRWHPFTEILATTTGVPGVWASTDHLCIVWCKQLILTIIRSLFDMVEFHQRNKYYVISDNPEGRRNILNYHFVDRSSGKSYHTSPKPRPGDTITLPTGLEQVEASGGLHCLPKSTRAIYVLYPSAFLKMNVTNEDDDDDARVVVMTTNVKERNWILGCVSSKNSICLQAENLSHLGKIIPHIKKRRKMANLKFSEVISKYSHLLVRMDPNPVKSCVMLETYSESGRRRPLTWGQFHSDSKIFYNLTVDRSPHSTSTFGGFIFNMMAWKIEARPQNESCPESHNLLATFTNGQFQQSRFLKNESLIARFSDWNQTSSSVQLYLEPTCNYTVTTTFAPLETAGQFFRLVSVLLPSFIVSVIMMTMFYQEDPKNWRSFHMILFTNAYHLSIFPGFLVAVILLMVPTDWPLALDPSEYSVVLPIFLHMIAYCIVVSISTGTYYAIITGGTGLHAVIVRLLSTRLGSWVPRMLSNHRGFTSVQDHMTEAAFEMTLTRFPLTIAVLLLSLSFMTCGSLAIAVCVVLYLVKLFKMYEDLLEDMLKAKIANVKDNLSQMNFHFSCFMLWLVVGALNVPSLLHWTRSGGSVVKATPQPQWDLSMYLCLLLLPTVAILWQDFVPKIDPYIWKIHRYVFYIMGLCSVLWGTHRLYVTTFLIVFTFLTLATCQLLSVMADYLLREQPPRQEPEQASNSASAPPPTSEETAPVPETTTASETAAAAGTCMASSSSTTENSKPNRMASTKEDLEGDPITT